MAMTFTLPGCSQAEIVCCCVLASRSVTLAGAPVTLLCCLVLSVVLPCVVWVKTLCDAALDANLACNSCQIHRSRQERSMSKYMCCSSLLSASNAYACHVAHHAFAFSSHMRLMLGALSKLEV